MEYREFGETGKEVSVLGFGAMRLPEVEEDGEYTIDEELAISMIHTAFEAGVNYIDTAYPYCHGNSEPVVGRALKGWRDTVYLSTKMPTWKVEKKGDYRRFLEEQLERLDVDVIDFYHFHGLNDGRFKDTVLKYDLLEEATRARDEGLIQHISFSFHDKPEVMKRMIDIGIFETVLCQYNLLDRSLEEAMAYARQKGVGVAVMGPVGGGRLAADSKVLRQAVSDDLQSTPELALRFVMANEDVSVALSGMENMEMVHENTRVANQTEPLTADELAAIERFLKKRKDQDEVPCTSCEYCLPCPNGVAIPQIFESYNYHQVYGLTKYAEKRYTGIASDDEKNDASECVECGSCEESCPQKIEIIELLGEIHSTIG